MNSNSLLHKRKELLSLIASDCIAFNLAWLLLSYIRFASGFFHETRPASEIPNFFLSAILMYCYWVSIFILFGLYRQWYIRSAFDGLLSIVKTVGIGTLIFVLFVLWGQFPVVGEVSIKSDPRVIGLIYFIMLSVLVVVFRYIAKYIFRRVIESGIGKRVSIILGDHKKATELARRVAQYPRLGYEVIGYISSNSTDTSSLHVGAKMVERIGELKDLESIIDEYKVQEVLITLDSGQHDTLLDVIGRAAKSNTGLKIVPDLYDIISGQARTREIYGFPLIDINPELQRPWEESLKRILDVTVSAGILIIGSPIWILTAMAVKFTSKGGIIYSQERVGRNGEIFHIYKFRSMQINAEASGPVWAAKNDPRVTAIGKFLRKSHLDEVPQLWCVLKGDMSLVGPRPERQFFITKLVKEIPYYTRRLKVRPGITGLYQAMVDKYDESIDDVKERVRYDLMYIESMSFRLDITILFRTAYMMLKGKGQA